MTAAPLIIKKLNVLNTKHCTKYEQYKQLLFLIGFRDRSPKKMEFDPDSIDNKVAELQLWVLKSVNTCQKGVTGTKKHQYRTSMAGFLVSHV